MLSCINVLSIPLHRRVFLFQFSWWSASLTSWSCCIHTQTRWWQGHAAACGGLSWTPNSRENIELARLASRRALQIRQTTYLFTNRRPTRFRSSMWTLESMLEASGCLGWTSSLVGQSPSDWAPMPGPSTWWRLSPKNFSKSESRRTSFPKVDPSSNLKTSSATVTAMVSTLTSRAGGIWSLTGSRNRRWRNWRSRSTLSQSPERSTKKNGRRPCLSTSTHLADLWTGAQASSCLAEMSEMKFLSWKTSWLRNIVKLSSAKFKLSKSISYLLSKLITCLSSPWPTRRHPGQQHQVVVQVWEQSWKALKASYHVKLAEKIARFLQNNFL